jgi:hypothetical protein
MPDLILTPPTFAEGQTIEVNWHGKTISIFWRDEDALVIDGDDPRSSPMPCAPDSPSCGMLRRP